MTGMQKFTESEIQEAEKFLKRAHVEMYDGMASVLARIEPYGETQLTTKENSSLRASTEWGGPSIPTFTKALKTLDPKFWEASMQRIGNLVESLSAEGLQAKDVRRKHAWGSQGYSLSMSRVYRGQLRSAWRQVKRETRIGATGVIVLVVPTTYPCTTKEDTIFWTAAATLALATKLEAAGRRVEIWGMSPVEYGFYGDGGMQNTPHSLNAIRLKRADEAWNMQDVIASCHKSFLRRYVFRLQEISAAEANDMVGGGYGSCLRQREWAALAHTYLTKTQGVHPDAVFFGPTWSAGTPNAEKALAWMREEIARIEAGDAGQD